MGFRLLSLLFGLFSIIVYPTDAAAQLDLANVPAELRPWTAWVLHDVPEVVCPDVAGIRRCAWPGELVVEAGPGGAEATMSVYADREVEVPLPGDRERWPHNVRIDGAPAIVGAEANSPTVRVPAGAHVVTAEFLWDEVPQVLLIPASVGRVSLRLESGEVQRPRIDGEGRLWLREGESGETADEADSLRASVYRKFSDGVPMTVTTRLRLNVSGRGREVSLGQVLISGSRPVAVRAAIPVQVGTDGIAKVYVRPGTHDVEIDAVIARPVDRVVAPTPEADFFDPQEVWVWAPDEAMRSVELGGLTSVDPDRTSLPVDWKGFTTFLAEPASELTLRETRRGIAEEPPNALSMRREIWLDVNRMGYTIRDRLDGTLNRDWRLNYGEAPHTRLGRVQQYGENLLITEDPANGALGVELRAARVDLEAELRVDKFSSTLPIVGWDHDVQHLSAQLHLPPGWTLLGGKGVDTMAGTWTESWTLWDFFFVLIVAFVVGRLFGWAWTIVTLFTLVLTHGQPDAPQWVWIHLIISLALLRVLPDGFWRKAVVTYRSLALAALVVILAPFVHSQILVALHPQVDQGRSAPSDWTFAHHEMAPEENFAVATQAAGAPAGRGMLDEIEEELTKETSSLEMKPKRTLMKKNAYKGSNSEPLQQVDPNAVVQTGPGLPDWTWSTWSLDWTGPVGRGHEVTLWLLSPTMNAVLGFVRVALLLLLGLLLLAPRDMYWSERRPAPRWWWRLFGGAAVLLAVNFAVVLPPTTAHAQTPDAAMLENLKTRIVAQSKCPDPCVVASDASLTVDGLELRMTVELSALRATAWTLPGPVDAFRISSVSVDGRPTTQLRREANGLTQVRLDEGAHRLIVKGQLPDRNVVTLQFDEATRPRHLRFDAQTWTVDGISPTGVPDNSIQLTRTIDREGSADASAAAAELPAWYQVERRLALGLPWRVYTTVSRLDATRPQLVKVGLVDAEKVISDGVRAEGSAALVDFARGELVKEFVGELPVSGVVNVAAAEGEPWTETWIVECSRIWRCTFSDLPPHVTTESGNWKPTWRPWPGEKLQITVERPTGAPGQPKTVDNVDYTVTPGRRLLQATLSLTVRASQGDWQEIQLPEGAALQSVQVDGVTRSIRPEGGKVRLPVQPGRNEFTLAWQQPWEREAFEFVPSVNIGSEAVNAHVTMNLGEERWLLDVRHGDVVWGPAILFWAHLGILLLLAILLGTLRGLPLGTPEWLLLAVGMSQLPVVVMAPVVGWFVVLSWRGRQPSSEWYRFNLAQILIVALTIAAVVALYAAVHTNLLVNIDMQVDGMNSNNHRLQWYAERVDGQLPTPGIVSVPLVAYRVAMFVWALWLAWRLVAWAKWGWTHFSNGGRWRRAKGKTTTAPQADGSVAPQAKEPQAPVEEPQAVEEALNVERNARDGELVKTEYVLGQPLVSGDDAWEDDEESTPALDEEEADPPEPVADVASEEEADSSVAAAAVVNEAEDDPRESVSEAPGIDDRSDAQDDGEAPMEPVEAPEAPASEEEEDDAASDDEEREGQGDAASDDEEGEADEAEQEK